MARSAKLEGQATNMYEPEHAKVRVDPQVEIKHGIGGGFGAFATAKISIYSPNKQVSDPDEVFPISPKKNNEKVPKIYFINRCDTRK